MNTPEYMETHPRKRKKAKVMRVVQTEVKANTQHTVQTHMFASQTLIFSSSVLSTQPTAAR